MLAATTTTGAFGRVTPQRAESLQSLLDRGWEQVGRELWHPIQRRCRPLPPVERHDKDIRDQVGDVTRFVNVLEIEQTLKEAAALRPLVVPLTVGGEHLATRKSARPSGRWRKCRRLSCNGGVNAAARSTCCRVAMSWTSHVAADWRAWLLRRAFRPNCGCRRWPARRANDIT